MLDTEPCVAPPPKASRHLLPTFLAQLFSSRCPFPSDIGLSYNSFLRTHRRQPRRGCRGHIPQYFRLGGRQREYPPILLRTFGYSTPILVALRSLSLKPIPFGYKTPPIRFSQAGGQSAHKARPPNLELVLTPLVATPAFVVVQIYLQPETFIEQCDD